MAAALAAGAEGARVGTRFVAAVEAEAHPDYVNALIAAEASDTVYTDVFYYGWPDAPHSVLRSRVEAVQAFEGGDVVGQRYWTEDDVWQTLHRFGSITVTKGATGAIEAISQWAGESVGEGEELAAGRSHRRGTCGRGRRAAAPVVMGV